MSSSPRSLVGVHYTVPRLVSGWELSEELMPESVLHDQAVEMLKALLAAWAARAGNGALVVRNLAVRWDESEPRIGVDPDVCVLLPSPPSDGGDLRSVRTWVDGHTPPILAIEVVSETNPHKDYTIAPDKYAASGTGELWVFDPLLAGPTTHGGPFRLQVWHRRSDGDFTRIYAGPGPASSPLLGAHLIATDEGRRLRIGDDPGASRLWLTGEEAERAAKEAERAAKEAALARIAELEASIARRGTKAD
jgi:Uma2 family endonuclease